MDATICIIAPRPLADLRPAADAAATARVDRPPLAMALVVAFAPASLSQEALVARTVLEPSAVDPVDTSVKHPERVLKPWGIPMLPSDPPDEASVADKGAADASRPTATTLASDASPAPKHVTLADDTAVSRPDTPGAAVSD